MVAINKHLLPRYDGSPDRSYVTRRCNFTLIICSSIVVFTRLWSRRYSNTLGSDDLTALVALAFAVTTASLELDALNFGMDRQIDQVDPVDLEKFFMTLPLFQLVTFNAVFFVRLSGVLFIRRLISGLRASIGIWIAVAVLTTQHLIFFFVFLFQCRPVRALWIHSIPRTCISRASEAHLMYLHSAVGVAIDISVMVVPMVFVWKHICNHKMRFRIVLILSVGSFVCIAGIARLAIITTINMGVNTTWNITYAAMWTQLEIHIGLIMSCFPALNPLFRRVKNKIIGASTTTSSSRDGIKGIYPKPGMNVELCPVGHRGERKSNIVRDPLGNESQEQIMPNVIHKSTSIEVSVETLEPVSEGTTDDVLERDGEEGISTKSVHIVQTPDQA